MNTWMWIAAGLALGLVAIWVWIWEWLTASQALDTMQKVPKKINTTLVMTILFIALVESAAIYGLIIAFQLAS